MNEIYESPNVPKPTKVVGDKLYYPDGVKYSEYGVNFGTQSKGNITTGNT